MAWALGLEEGRERWGLRSTSGESMKSDGMLVRAAGGDWERLSPRSDIPAGSFDELFGDDLGPVLGHPIAMPVLTSTPLVAGGTAPDVICSTVEGHVALVRMALGTRSETVLPDLLAIAGAFDGLDLEGFLAACGVDKVDELASRVMGGTPPKATREAWASRLAETLQSGRFDLVALVSELPESALASIRFLNRSGAVRISCVGIQLYASASVTALQTVALDTGVATTAERLPQAAAPVPSEQPKTPRESAASAKTAAGSPAALGSAIEAAGGPAVGRLGTLVAEGLDRIFDTATYTGAGPDQRVECSVDGVGDAPIQLVTLDSSGIVHVDFEALSPVDGDWSVRAELAQGMERLLGADLGDVKKISKLNVALAEHLMDATLAEAFLELVGDIVTEVRDDAEATRRRAAELEAAASAA